MFQYDLWRLPNAHLRTLEEGVTNIQQARERSGATIGYPGWGVIYSLLLAHLDRSRDQVLLETGTNWGCTTIVLAQALIDAGCRGRVLTFELERDNIERARVNLTRAGVADRVDLRLGDTRELMASALCELDEIRFAFLDASHLSEDVEREFEILVPKLADDALVLFDNTYRIAGIDENQRVNGFLRQLQGRHGGNLINLEFVSWFTPGLAVWQRRPKL